MNYSVHTTLRRELLRLLSLFISAMLICIIITGCKKTPPNNTDHPDHGKITLTTDWTDRTDGVNIPSSYKVNAGGFSVSINGVTNTIDNLFDPGTYQVYVYNETSNITVGSSNLIATVGTTTLQSSEGDETFIKAEAGWFFSSSLSVTLEKDKVHDVTAVMKQQTRELTLTLDITGGLVDDITSVSATLSGMAGSYDIDKDTYGNPSKASIVFTQNSEGEWVNTSTFLGISGNTQKLTGKITFFNDEPITFESDLNNKLSTFNTGKATPLSLTGETLITPTPAGFTVTIVEWTEVPRIGDAE